MEHTQEWHKKEVELLCRLCCKFVERGKALKKKNQPPNKQKFEEEIQHFFKINTSYDIEGKHSSRICHSCVMNILNLKNRSLTPEAIKRAHEKGQSADRVFCTFNNNLSIHDCTLCSHVQNQRPRQRATKRKADTSLQAEPQSCSSVDEGTYSQQEKMSQQTIEQTPQENQPASLAQQFPHQTYPFQSNPMPHDIYPATPQYIFPMQQHTPSLLMQQQTHSWPMPQQTQSWPMQQAHCLLHYTHPMPYNSNSIPYPTSHGAATHQVPHHTHNPGLQNIMSHSNNTHMNESSDLSGLTEQHQWIGRPAEQLNSFNPLLPSHVASFQTQNNFTPQMFSTPKKQIKLKPDHSPTKKSPKISPIFKRKKRHFGTSPIKPLNLMSFCSKPISETETATHKKACAKLLSNLYSESSDTIVIPSKTKGQPKIFKRVTKPRKKSSEICKTTLKKRVREQSNIRDFISGGDSLVQQAAETFFLPKVQKNSLQKKILGKSKIVINKKVGAALQTHAQLSYCQFNKIKRFLRGYSLHFENEGAVRKELKRLSAHKIDILEKDFEFNNENGDVITKTTPFLKISNLKIFTEKVLNDYSNKKLLTWHDGAIPEGEIWVKIGGDHGRDSFKVSYQIANVDKPNSKQFTFMIGYAKVKDTPHNLKLIFDEFKENIDNLNGMEWEGKKIKLFIVGDYAFLANIYGLSGASGKHPCLWCLDTKQDMQSYASSKYPSQTRTLEQLKTNHQHFVETGNSKIKEASKFNNVIREPLLNIPLNQVAPPVLHILLGVVKKHHTILEDYCDSLDIEIIDDLLSRKKTLENVCKPLKSFIKKCSKIRLKEKVNTRNLNQTDDNEMKKVIKASLNILKEEKQKLISKYPKCKGPVCSELDGILKSHKIELQAYHGRSFIGNHANKYLKENVISDISKSIIDSVKSFTGKKSIIQKAEFIAQTVKNVNLFYSRVHKSISHCDKITPREIECLLSQIKAYFFFYRNNMEQSVFPKLHFLEEHCFEWIRTYKVGMGLLSEQGTEQLHKSIRKLEIQSCGIVNEKQRLLTVMNKHLAEVCPEIIMMIPKIKSRKDIKKTNIAL